MNDKDEYLTDTGDGYGGEEIYYDDKGKTFYIREYVWHLDDSQEFDPPQPVTVDNVVKKITRNVRRDSAAALRRVSEITGNDYSDIIAECEKISDERERKRYWENQGPRYDRRTEWFDHTTIFTYRINDCWLPEFDHEYASLKWLESSHNPDKEKIRRFKDILRKKEREKKMIPLEDRRSQGEKEGYTTQYYRDKDYSYLYKKILLSPGDGIWLKIYYSSDHYYFRKYGIEYRRGEFVFDIHDETKLRMKLELTDKSQPLSTALIDYLKKHGSKALIAECETFNRNVGHEE